MSVYFIQAGTDGPVKIGYALFCEERLRELQIGNHEELRIIRIVDAPRSVESAFQRHFAQLRLRGEWFRFDDKLLTATVDDALAPAPVASKTFLDNWIVRLEVRAAQAGFTVTQVCAFVGVNRATWQRWKAGKNRPSNGTQAFVSEQIAKLVRSANRSEAA